MSAANTSAAAPARPATTPELDLLLVCAGNKTVAVNSAMLQRATHSEAIADVIALLQKELPGASVESPIKWQVQQDDDAHWQVVWGMIKSPLALPGKSALTWDNVQEVMRLADKYALVPVLQACQTWMCHQISRCSVWDTARFPHMSSKVHTLRVLRLKEQLITYGMFAADSALAASALAADSALAAVHWLQCTGCSALAASALAAVHSRWKT